TMRDRQPPAPCRVLARGPRPAVNPEISLDGDLSAAGDGRSEWRASAASARSPKKKQLLPEFRGDAASVRRPQICAGQRPKSAPAGISNCLPSNLRSVTFLRFLLLICLHQCHGSFSGGLFIVNAFHLPCLACPNGPDQPHGINAQTDQKLTYQLESFVVGHAKQCASGGCLRQHES